MLLFLSLILTGPADGQQAPPSGVPEGYWISVHIEDQSLHLFYNDSSVAVYPVSTSEFGVGSQAGSNRTPLGWHRISEKIGDSEPVGTVFVSRRSTGSTTKIYTDSTDLDEDLITTRILRLEGLEDGLNRGPGIDTSERAVYIHGTPEEGLIGSPVSHGCIRMKNLDIITLFNLVKTGDFVNINEF